MQILRVRGDGSSGWSPVTSLGDLIGVIAFCFWLGQPQPFGVLEEMLVVADGGSGSLSLNHVSAKIHVNKQESSW